MYRDSHSAAMTAPFLLVFTLSKCTRRDVVLQVTDPSQPAPMRKQPIMTVSGLA